MSARGKCNMNSNCVCSCCLLQGLRRVRPSLCVQKQQEWEELVPPTSVVATTFTFTPCPPSPVSHVQAFVPPSRLTFTRDSTAHKTKVASSSALRPSLSPDEMDHDGMPPAFKSGVFREGSSLVRPREEEAKGPGESAGDSQGRPLSKRRRTHGINQEVRHRLQDVQCEYTCRVTHDVQHEYGILVEYLY